MKSTNVSRRLVLHVILSLVLLANTILPNFVPAVFSQYQEQQVEGGATVTAQSPADSLQLGETFDVPIQISGLATSLSGFQFDLTYDPVILSFDGLATAPFLGSTGRSINCPQAVSPTPGTIRFACAGSGLVDGPTGDGTLATLTFTAWQPGTSPLTVSAVQLPGAGVPPIVIVPTVQSGSATVVTAPDVDLSGGGTIISSPGLTVSHTFTVTNLGNYTDTFNLAVSGNSWQTDPSADIIGPLAVGQSWPVEVAVIVPGSSSFAGETVVVSDTFTLTAASSWDGTLTDSANGTTAVNINPAVDLGDDQNGSGPILTQKTYSLTVTNTGDFPDTFTLGFSGNNWPVNLSATNSNLLQVGESFNFTAEISIPDVPDGAQDVVSISATSGWDLQVVDSVVITTMAVEDETAVYLPVVLSAGGTNNQATSSGTAEQGPTLPPGYRPTPVQQTQEVRPNTPPSFVFGGGCYITDLDCDTDVDENDLFLVAERWNCAIAMPCYDPLFDLDGSTVINVFDMAWVGNDYDVSPPQITLLSPQANVVVNNTNVTVSGLISETHNVISLTVNNIPATINGDMFNANITLPDGSQVIDVVAIDDLGQIGFASQIISVDTNGPMITVHQPPPRQSVYTLTPTVAISYTDFYSMVNPVSVSVTLMDENGVMTDLTGILTITPNGAQGNISTPLGEDMSYTMTVSAADMAANVETVITTFYVPLDPGNIIPPEVPEGAGWVSGVVYDSTNCDRDLVGCQPLAGAYVTLEKIAPNTLEAIRIDRAEEAEALWNQDGSLLEPISSDIKEQFSEAVTGTIVTGPDGFFAFPVGETASYWLRFEKDGYTYGQREADIVRERSSTTNNIFMTPLDSNVTPCDSSGCFHESSDGMLQVIVPPGAIPISRTEYIQATYLKQIEFLPNGELPPNTVETYAFELSSGGKDITFTVPITVRINNTRTFAAENITPVGHWNETTQAWEHAGKAVVDTTGNWVELQLTHFSAVDVNKSTLSWAKIWGNIKDWFRSLCSSGHEGCFIDYKSGLYTEWIDLPAVQVLDQSESPQLHFNSNRVVPYQMIDAQLFVGGLQGNVAFLDPVVYELYLEGQILGKYGFAKSVAPDVEVGDFRYLWDGRNVQGELLSPGIYDYEIDITVPYLAAYCNTVNNFFGAEPFCLNPTGVIVLVWDKSHFDDSVAINPQLDSPFGAGWLLNKQQTYYASEDGNVLISDGERLDEFYVPWEDLLQTNRNDFNWLAWTNEDANSIQILPEDIAEGNWQNDNISTGDYPLAMDLSPDGNTAYVVNRNDGTISVIDLITHQEAYTITVETTNAQSLGAIQISPDGALAYVANNYARDTLIEVVDLASQTVTDTIFIHYEFNGGHSIKEMIISPDGNGIYYFHYHPAPCQCNVFQYVDINTEVKTTLPGNRPSHLIISNDGQKGYAITGASSSNKSLTVYDLVNQQTAFSIPLAPSVDKGLAISSDGQYAYVSGHNPSGITIIDLVDRSVVGLIQTGSDPTEIVVSSDDRYVYVAHDDSSVNHDWISILDLAKEEVLTQLSVPNFPEHLEISPNDSDLYFLHYNRDLLSVMDTGQKEIVSIEVDNLSITADMDLHFSPQGGLIYASSPNDNVISVVSVAYQGEIDAISLSSNVYDLVITQDG